MNQNYTDISIVQDKSGSMNHLRDETISGYNAFLKEQRQVPGKCTVTLTQFDTEFKTVYRGIDIASAPELTRETYQPGGFTALLDAIALTIISTGKRLSDIPEPDRPARVIFVITTDGEENSSKEHTRDQVMAMIKEQTDHWKWQFIFLGANQDAIKAGQGMGMKAGNIISAGITGQAVKESYAAFSGNIRSYRLSSDPDDVQKLAFTQFQREQQRKQGAAKDDLNK